MYRIIMYIIILVISQAKSYVVEVRTTSGLLVGSRAMTVFDRRLYYAFYGIPYAKPPIGKLRFKNPKPWKTWDLPIDASVEYHGACAQSHIVHRHQLYGAEDCLNLNIYTPKLPTSDHKPKIPVIVFIHGYGYTSSLSHLNGPDFLIDNDVILITLSHRVGVFGFLKLNDSDTHVNMGLKDICMGLKWIKNNVDRFGGNKWKITVMGTGSGGTYISLLLATECAELFTKMILHSGTMFAPNIFLNDPKYERERLLKELKNKGHTDIMAVSPRHLIAASNKIYNNKDILNIQRPLVPFSPLIESIKYKKSLLKMPPEILYKDVGRAILKLPILVGFVSQEGISEAIPFIHNSLYLRSFQTDFRYMVPFSGGCRYNYTTKEYKTIAQKIKDKYFKNDISEFSLNEFLKYTSDLRKYPIIKFIKNQLAVPDSQLYVYKFNYLGQFNGVKATSMGDSEVKVRGAASGDELCYILKCEPFGSRYADISQDISNRDRIFTKMISKMWADFAKTGKPTPDFNSKDIWPMMTAEKRNMMLFANITKATNFDKEERMYDFWNDIYEKYYTLQRCKGRHDEL